MTDTLRHARVDFGDAAAPRSLDFDDLYHPRAGAYAQARHVFLDGNALPQRWARSPRFVILETGFGFGHNFLATWAAWHDDPQRCERLWFVSIEQHPPSSADLRHVHTASPRPELAQALLAAWPPLTPDLHRRDFAGGRVSLLLAFGDAQAWLPQLQARVDAFFLDGFAPAKNPQMWSPRLLGRLRHLAAPGATAATWSAARPVRDGLADAGFEVQRRPGFDAKRDMLSARFAPRYELAPPAGRRFGDLAGAGRVAIVGAGLAGAATARALALQGIPTIVFDRMPVEAGAASGNPAGLVHGVVHADDGPHARWHRAAALRAVQILQPLLDNGSVTGRLDGLLRLEHALDLPAMQRLLAARALPDDYVRALSAADAAERAGADIQGPAWIYTAAGWVDPRTVVRAWLAHDRIETRLATTVERIDRRGTDGWRLLDAGHRCLVEVDHVVLANAHDAQRLAATSRWLLQSSRGQLTQLSASVSGSPRLRLPIAGAGYAIPLPDGDLLCGATVDADDLDPALRASDHARNLASLSALIGRSVDADPARLPGRVAWRLSTLDRLPLVGALPDTECPGRLRQDQPRHIARLTGVHLLAALGSRGIAQSALGGEIVASWIAGAPMPVGGALLDAVDVARLDARARRVRRSSP
jgi:tRNA 5-methylaminomethyl-2-thiouridine biosynthesis bifunctional protein